MSYFLNDELELLQQSAKQFAETVVAQYAQQIEDDNAFPREIYLELGKAGLLSLIVPQQLGGAGAGLTAVGVVTEEIAKVSPALAISYYVDACMVSYVLESPHRAELLPQWLSGLMSGQIIMAAGITPPQGASNIAEWPVVGVHDGDEWVLNATKMYVTNCGAADVVAFLGLTDDGEMGCWFVERTQEGIEDNHLEPKIGLCGNRSGSYFLTDVRVPANRFFQKNPLKGMGPGNALCAAVALGCAEGALAKTIEFTKHRTRANVPIVEKQVVAHRLARMWGEIERSRALIYEALGTADKVLVTGDQALGVEAKRLISTSKYTTCEMAVEVTKQCIWLHGGLGVVRETGVEHYFRDAETLCVADGTPDLHVETVAYFLGLPGSELVI